MLCDYVLRAALGRLYRSINFVRGRAAVWRSWQWLQLSEGGQWDRQCIQTQATASSLPVNKVVARPDNSPKTSPSCRVTLKANMYIAFIYISVTLKCSLVKVMREHSFTEFTHRFHSTSSLFLLFTL